jgi:predicted GNAT family acetyltransferase
MINMIEIKQTKDGTKGRFAAIDDGKEAGAIFYTSAGESKMILDHTEVNDAYRGQSIGKKILMKIVEFARENKIKIIPLCPYAKSVFDKTESIRDVLV